MEDEHNERPMKRHRKSYLEPNYTQLHASNVTNQRWTAVASGARKSLINYNVRTEESTESTQEKEVDTSTLHVQNVHYCSEEDTTEETGKYNSILEGKEVSVTEDESSIENTADSFTSEDDLGHIDDSTSATDNDHFLIEDDKYDYFENNRNIMFLESGVQVQEVYCMVVGLSMRYHFSKEAEYATLNLLKLLAGPRFNSLKINRKTLSQNLPILPNEIISYIFYCFKCYEPLLEPLSKKEVVKQNIICRSCKQDNLVSFKSENRFLKIDIKHQIQTLLSKKDVLKELINKTSAIKSIKRDNFPICDIHDGKLYTNNINSAKSNSEGTSLILSYNLSTDGAPLFKSSKRSFWPLQISINELPLKLRYTNLILAALCILKSEPTPKLMNLFMTYFVQQANILSNKGLTVIDAEGRKLRITLVPICAAVDTVARPIIQNRIQFNGYWGCSWCYARGEHIKGSMRYPINLHKDELLRTNESHFENVKQSIEKGMAIEGVKGTTIMADLPYFDCIWGFPIDYMHGMILGVTRQIWELWTTPGTSYYLKPSNRKEINERLLNIKPPQSIYRSPRSLNDRRQWKAAEWRSWLLFYTFPCLKGILKPELLESFLLFVRSIHILLQPTISENDFKVCEIDLFKFVGECQIYYGKSAMTFNIHSALHLCHSVLQSGPLWATSTFPYESNIYILKQEVSSPKSVDEQMANRYLRRAAYENYINNLKISEKCSVICKSIISRNKYFINNNDVTTENGATFSGAPKLVQNADKYYSLLECHSNYYNNFMNNEKVHIYERCIFSGNVLHTAAYSKTIKTNDSVVQLDDDTIIEILSFIVVNKCCFVVVKVLTTMPAVYNQLRINHKLQVTSEAQDEKIIPIQLIKRKLLVVELECDKFLCTMPNQFETL